MGKMKEISPIELNFTGFTIWYGVSTPFTINPDCMSVESIDAGQPIKISTTLKWSVNMSANFFRPLPILFAIFFL